MPRTDSLLDAGFIATLESLRRRLAPRVSSGLAGDHASRRRGVGHAFEEHRPYAYGDDLRRVDWSTLARTDEPMVKVFRAEEDALVRIFLDASASLEGEKFDHARRLAAAMAYLGLAAGERVSLSFLEASPGARGAALRGRPAMAQVLQSLHAREAMGKTNLAKALPRGRFGRPGLLVVISDFLDDSAYLDALGRAAHQGHELMLVQVLQPEEVNPTFGGDMLLEDAEDGTTVPVTLDAESLATYRAGLAALCDGLRSLARRHQGTYVRALTDRPLDDTIGRVVQRAIEEPLAA